MFFVMEVFCRTAIKYCQIHLRKFARHAYGHAMKFNSTFEGRFWAKVQKGLRVDDCWSWKGTIAKSGYGSIWTGFCNANAHRTSWVLHFGPIFDGLYVLHHCDNPPCCNPKHLFLGTQQENMDDMTKKGRSSHAVGPESSKSKLTADQVLEIRSRYAAGGISYRGLAKIFGMGSGTICHIVLRKTYRNV